MRLAPVEPRARVRARSALNVELLQGAKHRDADIVFDDDYSLDLGGLKAKIYAMGTNHTHGDTVVLVDGVLFSGDVAMRPQPSFANPTAKISHWLESLDKLEALKPKQLVPSHGPFGDVAIIAGYRTYFTHIRDRAAELKKAGKSQDEASRSSRMKCLRSTRTRTGWRARSARPIPVEEKRSAVVRTLLLCRGDLLRALR